ncbi:MAG TPA: hypothetical protein VFD58_14650 [Blastocatellia bacterium]|nr:hypothetical protein [Blastocatellia bacterium]
MKRTRKVTITTTRRRTLRVQPAIRARCPVCQHEVETLATAHAAEVLEIDAETLNRLVAAGRVHAIETVSGSFRVCQESLFSK